MEIQNISNIAEVDHLLEEPSIEEKLRYYLLKEYDENVNGKKLIDLLKEEKDKLSKEGLDNIF